jgi:hypothetical protein
MLPTSKIFRGRLNDLFLFLIWMVWGENNKNNKNQAVVLTYKTESIFGPMRVFY